MMIQMKTEKSELETLSPTGHQEELARATIKMQAEAQMININNKMKVNNNNSMKKVVTTTKVKTLNSKVSISQTHFA